MHHQTIGRATALPPGRFFAPKQRRRLLVFGSGHFPDPSQIFSYELSVELADRIDADARFMHFEKSDPRHGGGLADRWMAYAFLAPVMAHPVRADLEHFRTCCPERFQSLVDLLANRLGVGADDVVGMPMILAAVSQARWAQAWEPDVIATFYSHLGGLAGFITAWLLGLPRVHFHYPIAGDDDPSVATQADLLQSADVVCVPGEDERSALHRDFAGALDARVLSQREHANWQITLAERMHDAMRMRAPAPGAAALGPRAAFATCVDNPPAATAPTALTTFVVVGAERTGSNLLVDMLATHPDIAAVGELFNTRMIDEGQLDTRTVEPADADALLRLRRVDPAGFLRAIARQATRGGQRVFGFKLLYYHMLSDNRVVDHLLSKPDLRVIHLVRRDRVARYVSQLRAERTDHWWSAAADDAAQRRAGGGGDVEVDPRLLLWDMQFTEQLEDRARATFAGCRGVEIAYEDLAADLDGATGRALALVDLPPMPLAPQSRKQGEGDAPKRIVNWQELRGVFRGTRWGHLF
jgi:LPS sulfotransferase NodH